MILERLTTMKTVQALSGPICGSGQTTVVAKLNRSHKINGC